MPSISFFRQYYGYTGGHQKVRDYLQHFLDLGFEASLYLENRASFKRELFDDIKGLKYQTHYKPNQFDIVFLAGMDWQHYLATKEQDKPIINLIQHVRHGEAGQELFNFLKHEAIRVCVSQAVKDAIEPYANGPCHVIRMGHDIPVKPSPIKSNDVYILANKQPKLGIQLEKELSKKGHKTIIHSRYVDTAKVLSAMASSRITITLPHKTEGFYLPGIEAAYLSDVAIVPDCIANREYCGRFSNIVSCGLDEQSILVAYERAHSLLQSKSLVLRNWYAKRIVQSYSLVKERDALKNLLKQYIV